MPPRGSIPEMVHRHWSILRCIPRAPQKIDAAAVERRLSEQGIEVTRRSIQRDLEALGQFFVGLRCDDRTKPYGWSWDEQTPLLELPGMGLEAAVTFELLRAHLQDALPASTVQTLRPYFRRAREVLGRAPEARMSRWPKKVAVVPRGLPRKAPPVNRAVQRAVYTALLEEQRLRVRYRKRGADVDTDYEVSPLGLVLRNGTLVLVGTFWDYDDPNQMILHRMRSADVLDTRARRPRGFDLEAYVEDGHLGFRRGDRLRLRLRIHERVAPSLFEAPLSDDQALASDAVPWLRLTATVPDTTELRSWLRSYGADVVVDAPKRLRDEMMREAQAVAALYDG